MIKSRSAAEARCESLRSSAKKFLEDNPTQFLEYEEKDDFLRTSFRFGHNAMVCSV